MRRLKIMSDDVPMASGDVFGVNDLQDRLKAFCREHGLEPPRFWIFPPDGFYICYAVSLHLNDNDRCEQFDAHVVFMLKDFSTRDNREMEAGRLQCMFEELGKPILLTCKVAERPDHQQRFYKSIGLDMMPVRWQDDSQNDYEVYVKGNMVMDAFASVMDRVEFIGKEIVYQEDDGK